MKVLLILEDPTLDQFVVKPIVERLLDDAGRTAQVFVLTDPHLCGTGDALDRERLAEIVEDNPMIDLFLLVVDRDCDRDGNSTKLQAREAEIGTKLIGCLAVEEVETWVPAHTARTLEDHPRGVRPEGALRRPLSRGPGLEQARRARSQTRDGRARGLVQAFGLSLQRSSSSTRPHRRVVGLTR